MSSAPQLAALRALAQSDWSLLSSASVSERAEAAILAKQIMGELAAHASRIDLDELALANGSYWEGCEQHLTVLSATVRRLATSSPFRWLPRELLQHICSIAFRPWREVLFAPLPELCPPRCYLDGGKRVSLPMPPGNSASFTEPLSDDFGGALDKMPFPTIGLPAVKSCFYVELSMDDMFCNSKVFVHDVCVHFLGEGYDDDNGCVRVKGAFGRRSIPQWSLSWRDSPCRAVPSHEDWFEPQCDEGRGPGRRPCTCNELLRGRGDVKAHRNCANVTLGMLVDLSMGSVALHLNGEIGPRAMLGKDWEEGVVIRFAGSFPEEHPPAWTASLEQPRRVPPGLYSAKDISEFESVEEDPDDADVPE